MFVNPSSIARPLALLIVGMLAIAGQSSRAIAAEQLDEEHCIGLTSQYKKGMKDLCQAMLEAEKRGWEYLASANGNDIWFVRPGNARLSMWVHVEYVKPLRNRVMSSRHLFDVNCTSMSARQLQISVHNQRGLQGVPLEHSNERGQSVIAPPDSVLEALVKVTCRHWTQQ